jgi:hypothetical protein
MKKGFYNQIVMGLLSKVKFRKALLRWTLVSLALILTITWLILTPAGLLGKADAVVMPSVTGSRNVLFQ